MSSLEIIKGAWYSLFIKSALSPVEPKSDRSAIYGIKLQLPGVIPDIPIDILLGYNTTSKINSLKRNYLNEEEINIAKNKLSQKESCSISFSLKSGEKYSGGKLYRNVDHCMVSAVIYKDKGAIKNITIFYRSTEICRKWLPDLVFLKEEIFPRLEIDSYESITFMFGRIVTKSDWFWIILKDRELSDRERFLRTYGQKKPKGLEYLGKLIQKVEDPNKKLLRSQKACYDMFKEDRIFRWMKNYLKKYLQR